MTIGSDLVQRTRDLRSRPRNHRGRSTVGALAGLGLGGLAGAVVLGAVGHALGDEVFERHVERSLLLDADLGERWDLRENQDDLERLLDLLFDLANGVGEASPRKRAVFILAGDIHAGTMHLIRSLPMGTGRGHTANAVIAQLTSSAISHAPVDDEDLWAEAVSKVDDDFDFGLRDLAALQANPLTDWKDVARRGIENALGDGQGRYTLDPNRDRRFVCETTGLVMERTLGHVRVERRDPHRRVYRFHLAIEGERERFRPRSLDADEIAPKLLDAEFVRRQGPVNLEPLRPAEVAVTMRNTGPTSWGTGFGLDIDQTTWVVDRAPVTTTVPPGREHTFHFRIVAPGSARSRSQHGWWRRDASRSASRPRPYASQPSPTVTGTTTCDELRQEYSQHQQTLRQQQAELSEAPPPAKAQLIAQIQRTRAAIKAIAQLMASRGCGSP